MLITDGRHLTSTESWDELLQGAIALGLNEFWWQASRKSGIIHYDLTSDRIQSAAVDLCGRRVSPQVIVTRGIRVQGGWVGPPPEPFDLCELRVGNSHKPGALFVYVQDEQGLPSFMALNDQHWQEMQQQIEAEQIEQPDDAPENALAFFGLRRVYRKAHEIRRQSPPPSLLN